jgi:hypothetical protein
MFRSLCLKLSVLCVSFVSLAGPVSAQGPTGPIVPQQPAIERQTTFTDEWFMQSFHKIDPNVKTKQENDGSTTYLFKVKRDNGIELLLSVNVSPAKVVVGAVIADPFNSPLPVDELNRHLDEINRKLSPVKMEALQIANGQTIVIAMREIYRGVDDGAFVQQWNGFLATATDLRVEAMRK